MKVKAGAVVAALGAAAAATAVWSIVIERQLFTVRKHTVPVLSPGSEPIRVLHISDLHLAPWQHGKSEWVQSLLELQADLIINTGDNIGHPDALPLLRETLAPFVGVPGLFVHGSNDKHAPYPKNPFKYFSGPSKAKREIHQLDSDAMDDFFENDLGWINLNNAAASLSVNGEIIHAIGVDDPHHNWDDPDAAAAALRLIQAESPDSPPVATLGVAHAPYRRTLNGMVWDGADVIFAGHTHGGQVCLPGFGTLVANCDIPLEQAKGLSTWHGVPLNVSAGLGNSIYAPIRFACRPEVSLITLVARSE